ncbi:MAG: hypothetical protein OEV87_05390 [Phycisphaerae bacterium]|nr:hypothetical protein [Phycisphaerae bacterium]
MNKENSNSDVYLPGLGRLTEQLRSILQFFCKSRLQESPMSDVTEKELIDNLDPLAHKRFSDEMNVLLGVE